MNDDDIRKLTAFDDDLARWERAFVADDGGYTLEGAIVEELARLRALVGESLEIQKKKGSRFVPVMGWDD